MFVPRILLLGTLVALWVLSLAVYPDLPAQLPRHLNGAGVVDRWGPKAVTSWILMPALATAIAALLVALGAVAWRRPGLINYPGKERVLALPPERRGPAVRHVQAMMEWIALTVSVTMAIVQYVLYEAAMGRTTGALLPVAIAVGVIAPPIVILAESVRVGRAVDAAQR